MKVLVRLMLIAVAMATAGGSLFYIVNYRKFRHSPISLAIGTPVARTTFKPIQAPPEVYQYKFWTEPDGRPKLFLTTRPCAAYEDQQLTISANRDLPFFTPYQILQPHNESTSYWLANKASVKEGWVSAENGVVITTRQGIDIHRYDVNEATSVPDAKPGQASFDLALPFARSPEELQKILEGVPDAPLPLARLENPKDVSATFMKWPLLESADITVHGKPVHAYRVLVIGADGGEVQNHTAGGASPIDGAVPSLKREDLEEVLSAISRLDICVVMDHTNSMTPWHNSFRDRIQQLARGLHKQYPDVDMRIGFGTYQDDLGRKEDYIDKYFGSFEINQKIDQLNELEAAVSSAQLLSISSVDHAECVFSGAVTAINQFGWRPGARRVLLVCGDAENHPDNSPKNHQGYSEDTLAQLLAKLDIIPFCLHTSNQHGKLLSEQLKRVADAVARIQQNRNMPTGTQLSLELSESGFSSMIATMFQGNVQDVDQGRRAVEPLILRGANDRKLGTRIETLDANQITTIITVLEGRPADQLGPKFKAIIQGLKSGQEPSKAQSLAVYTAWVPESISGTPVVETYEYMSKTELKLLQTFLLEIQQIDSDSAVELLTAGRYAAVFGDQGELTKWLDKQDAIEPLSRYMLQKHHIVTRTDLFQLTKDELSILSPQRRIELLNLAEKYHDYLQQILANSDFWRRIGEEDHVWLPSRHLP